MSQSDPASIEIVPTVGAAGFLFLFLFCVLIPWGAFRSQKKLSGDEPLPPKRQYFVSVLVTQIFLAGFALWVANWEGIELFPRVVPSARDFAWGAALLAIAITFMRSRWKKAVLKGERKLYLFTPRDRVERMLWIATSLCAGIGEEISYRGVMATLFSSLTGSVAIAVVLSAIVFGLSHMVQGWKSSWIVFVFALGFHALVLLTGSLYVAMAVHVTYDVVAGLTYGYLAKKLGTVAANESTAPAG